MLEFIFVPVIVGICVAGVYGLFELFARRKERIMMIEKLSEKMDFSDMGSKFNLPDMRPRLSFSALKVGCLLIGVGLGLLVAFFINVTMWNSGFYNFNNANEFRHSIRGLQEVTFGASVLLFGGAGLIFSFILEKKMVKKSDK
jgi:hypothetical protein